MSTTYDESVAHAWQFFEVRLGHHLGGLGEHVLVVDVEAAAGGDGCAPYVQFLGDDEMIHAEVSSNVYLDAACALDPGQEDGLSAFGWRSEPGENWQLDVPRAEAPYLASVVVGTLRKVLGVEHPRFLRWPDDAVDDDEPVAPFETGTPHDQSELDAMVDEVISERLGTSVDRDDDGDVPLRQNDAVVWVRAQSDTGLVRLFSYVACDVSSRRRARLEADILNRRTPLVKFHVSGRLLVATIDVPAMPLVAAHLSHMIDLMFHVLEDVAGDMVLRTGGRPFLDGGGDRRRSDA